MPWKIVCVIKSCCCSSVHGEDSVYMKYAVASNYVNVDGTHQIYLLKEYFIRFLMSYLTPHDAPYKEKLDTATVRLHSVSKQNNDWVFCAANNWYYIIYVHMTIISIYYRQ